MDEVGTGFGETEMERPGWELAIDARASVGEVPIWSSEEQSLYWIDIHGPTLNRTHLPSGDTRTWTFPDEIGCYGLTADRSQAVVALHSGIYRLGLEDDELVQVHDAPYDREHMRFNDGRCDARGRFWVGTIRLPESSLPDGCGSFWSLDERGLLRQIDDITVANGIAFSPDHRTMYLADRPGWQILAFDYEPETGIATGRRQFARVPEGQFPDGAAIDRDGGYWIALFAAGRIARFLPDGSLDRVLAAPVTHPTMVTFGGPDHATLYVTTARAFLDQDGLEREPLAGGIFACDIGAAGLPEPPFALPTSWR